MKLSSKFMLSLVAVFASANLTLASMSWGSPYDQAAKQYDRVANQITTLAPYKTGSEIKTKLTNTRPATKAELEDRIETMKGVTTRAMYIFHEAKAEERACMQESKKIKDSSSSKSGTTNNSEISAVATEQLVKLASCPTRGEIKDKLTMNPRPTTKNELEKRAAVMKEMAARTMDIKNQANAEKKACNAELKKIKDSSSSHSGAASSTGSNSSSSSSSN